jgi:hypothetical protein
MAIAKIFFLLRLKEKNMFDIAYMDEIKMPFLHYTEEL